MGAELDTPILNKKPIDGETKLYRYGINEVQGYKKTMEVFNIKDNDLGPEKNVNIFGLFEGHSGKEIAKYLSMNFNSELLKNDNFINGNYKQALIETFKKIDASLRTEEVNNNLIKMSQKTNFEKNSLIYDLYKTIDENDKINEKEIDEINTLMDVINPNNLEGVFIADYVGCSGVIILIDDKPPSVSYTLISSLLASIEFSTNSFTTEAHFSTTSPAAILLARLSLITLILLIISPKTLLF